MVERQTGRSFWNPKVLESHALRILNQPYASPTSIREIPEQLSRSFPARQIAYPMMMLSLDQQTEPNLPDDFYRAVTFP
jgi:hypothetical protein